MIIALSFVGNLPDYILDSIHQIRCYYQDEIYLITNDTSSPYISDLDRYKVNIIDYDTVSSNKFIQIATANIRKFNIVYELTGREELFVRSFERFFILQNLMHQRSLTDCLFLELDNLIYDDPHKWIPMFSTHDLCYMYDNTRRFSSGIMYVKNGSALDGFLHNILDFIAHSNDFMTEMTVLSDYYDAHSDKVQILPTYWTCHSVPSIAHEHYDRYHSIFDALSIGIYLFGLDPHHTGGVIKTKQKSRWSAIDYTNLQFEWKTDELGRKRPYVWNGDSWLLINNLHIHSKDLKSGLSIQR